MLRIGAQSRFNRRLSFIFGGEKGGKGGAKDAQGRLEEAWERRWEARAPIATARRCQSRHAGFSRGPISGDVTGFPHRIVADVAGGGRWRRHGENGFPPLASATQPGDTRQHRDPATEVLLPLATQSGDFPPPLPTFSATSRCFVGPVASPEVGPFLTEVATHGHPADCTISAGEGAEALGVGMGERCFLWSTFGTCARALGIRQCPFLIPTENCHFHSDFANFSFL